MALAVSLRRMAAPVMVFGVGLVITAAAAERPNIVYILADDLGYGDVQCLNPQRGKIPTPHLDQLAAQGMVFTDAHSGSSVCTPTRYGILTGRYAWRTRLQSGVLDGYSAPLIAPERLTVPALLRQHGYDTACIGKWHLGMELSRATNELRLTSGPTSRGFDYFFGISASLDMPPYAFIENDRLTQAPVALQTTGRKGPKAPDFEAVDVLPTLTRKAVAYIQDRAASSKPFFLYLPLTSPHTPIVPTAEWKGRSGLNNYADFVMQTDASVGQVLAALTHAGRASNTLVIVTSDNGCSPAAHVGELEQQGHFPSAQLRGYKSDIWDGGHRIPFLVRWPGHIQPGSHSDQVVCLTDLMATCAEILGVKLPETAGEDSASLGAAFRGEKVTSPRQAVVHHSIRGAFAIRQANWKLELCTGSGGWGKGGVTNAPAQLYDLAVDLAERTNQFHAHPEIVSRLTTLLEAYVASGRSTPGAKQTNDVPIVLRKKNLGDAEARE